MLEFKYPIPIITPLGEAYAIYVTNSGTFEDDVWCCALCEGGQIRHFRSYQIKMHFNSTFDIKKDNNEKG